MSAAPIDIQDVLNAVKAEADLLVTTINDKGAKRFAKAFGLSTALMAGAYFGVYLPPQQKIARLSREISAARTLSVSANAYQDLRGQLSRSYVRLPQSSDQQQWLSAAVIDSLRADSLTPDAFRPVAESESGNLVYQTASVQFTIKFEDLFAWLVRLESAAPLMHVSNLDIGKKTDMLGWNTASVSVMTVIPKKRFD